jgi:hypothetical protein
LFSSTVRSARVGHTGGSLTFFTAISNACDA